MNRNEPIGDVYTSAYSGDSRIINLPSIIEDIKRTAYDLHENGIVHVLTNEQPPSAAHPLTTYENGKKVVVKDFNGMKYERGRYYKTPQS